MNSIWEGSQSLSKQEGPARTVETRRNIPLRTINRGQKMSEIVQLIGDGGGIIEVGK
jgi:hypothetical protein